MPLFEQKKLTSKNLMDHEQKQNNTEETAKEFHPANESEREASKFQKMLDMYKNLEIK
nr:hypothetical protein [Lysinibacillus timonensis]